MYCYAVQIVPLGFVVILSIFTDFMCFTEIFSKCPIGALLVGAIEQVQIEVIVFASWHDWIQFVRTTRGDFAGPGLVCNAHFEEGELLCLIME